MSTEASLDRTPAVVRRTIWQQRLLPYRDVLLAVRSLVMWENGFFLALAAIGIHVALYLLFEFFHRSTFFGLLFSTLGTIFPVLFFARKADFLKYIQRQPRPNDNTYFDAIVNSAAECDVLVDWVRAQIQQRIDTVNPLAIIGVTFAFSALGALFNTIPTFYVCWVLAQALLFFPGCYVHGVFHRARVLAENGIQAAVPLLQQLTQTVSASVRAGLTSQQPSNQQPLREQHDQQHYRQPSQQNYQHALHRGDSFVPPAQTGEMLFSEPHLEQAEPTYNTTQFHTTDQYQQFPSPLPAYLQPSIINPQQQPQLDPEFLALLTPEERRANGV